MEESSDTSGGFLSSLGDLFTKAGTTAVDVIAAQQAAKLSTANNPNVNPAALLAAQQAAAQQQNASVSQYMPYILGGVALIGVVLAVVVISRRSN